MGIMFPDEMIRLYHDVYIFYISVLVFLILHRYGFTAMFTRPIGVVATFGTTQRGVAIIHRLHCSLCVVLLFGLVIVSTFDCQLILDRPDCCVHLMSGYLLETI